MVKNTCGGNKHKGHARKHVTAKPSNKLRIADNEGELYAVVTRMLGNGMFYAHCIDDRVCLGHIRGKFSGRGKRDNMVEPGKWVLVGERPWDSGKDDARTRKCDLLEVYTDLDRERLRDAVSANWSILLSQGADKAVGPTEATDGIAFSTERDEEYERLMGELVIKDRSAAASSSTVENNNDWINVDDI